MNHDHSTLEEFVRALAQATTYRSHDLGFEDSLSDYWKHEAQEWVKEIDACLAPTLPVSATRESALPRPSSFACQDCGEYVRRRITCDVCNCLVCSHCLREHRAGNEQVTGGCASHMEEKRAKR